MVQYATAEDLASYLQQNVDTSTANLVLTLASAAFTRHAWTAFAPTAVTYTTTGTSASNIILPFYPVISVSAMRINGVTVTGAVLRGRILYRAAGFGTAGGIPPDLLEVDLTHGYTAVPDDVKGAVLETAAAAYHTPLAGVSGESIDDYSVRYSSDGGGGVRLTDRALALALDYRGTVAA